VSTVKHKILERRINEEVVKELQISQIIGKKIKQLIFRPGQAVRVTGV
jgi:hypothetical protein